MAVISKNKILLDKLMNKFKMGEKINMPKISKELVQIRSISIPFFNLTYEEMIEYLNNKYGPVNGDYFIISKNGLPVVNHNLTRPEKCFIHHIREDTIANLSTLERARYFPIEYQRAHNLVYASLEEHVALHYRIFMDALADKWFLGIGGLIHFSMLSDFLRTSQNDKAVSDIVNNILIKLISLKSIYTDDQESFDQINNYISVLSTVYNKLPNIEKALQALKKGATLPADAYKERLQRTFNLNTYICWTYPIGVSKITSTECYKFFPNSFVLHYPEIYIIRSPQDKTAICYYSKTVNRIGIFAGGKRKNTNFSTPEELYQNLDTIYDFYSQVLSPVMTSLEHITSQFPNFFLHGLILDIDVENHIIYDIINHQFIGYSSSFYQYNLGLIDIKESPLVLLESCSQTVPALLSNELSLTPRNINTGLVSTNHELISTLYKINRKIYAIEQTIALKQLNNIDDFISNEFCDSYRQTQNKPSEKILLELLNQKEGKLTSH